MNESADLCAQFQSVLISGNIGSFSFFSVWDPKIHRNYKRAFYVTKCPSEISCHSIKLKWQAENKSKHKRKFEFLNFRFSEWKIPTKTNKWAEVFAPQEGNPSTAPPLLPLPHLPLKHRLPKPSLSNPKQNQTLTKIGPTNKNEQMVKIV